MHAQFFRILFRVKTFLFVYCASLIFCNVVSAVQPIKPLALYIPREYDPRLTHWLIDYLNTITDETPLEDILDAILEYRAALQLQGYTMPPVSELMPYFRENLRQRGIDMPEEAFNFLHDAFYKREHRFFPNKTSYQEQCGHHKDKKKKNKKKDDWEFSFSKQSIFGLVKFIGGALTCLVPHPAASGVGIFLMSQGVEDIINECRDGKKPDHAEENKHCAKEIEASGCP